MPEYAEFRLRIERDATSRSYRIVASGFGAEASGRFMLPLSSVELENVVLRLGRTRRGTRQSNSPEMTLAREFGTRLFDAVFEGDVRELYRSSWTQANDLGKGLRVSLALTGAPELLQVPWEYLFDRPNFLAISTWSPIVRYLDLAKPPRPLQVTFPLRILGMVSAPSNAQPILVDVEKQKLEEALRPLIERGVLAIDWLEPATLLALAQKLRHADYHVFHYIGHGGFDNESKDGLLLFQDEHGLAERVSGAQLGDILHDERTLRLAVLNACEGARSSLNDPFTGVATSLIEREIPAVIGMQFEITDNAAIAFASEFYSTLADGQPVDAAISEARKSIYAMGNDVEWGTPVLYLRVNDGRLFDIAAHEAVIRPDPAEAVASQRQAAEAAERERQAAEAAERERQVAETAERERQVAETAERARLAAEAAERDRVAAEAAQAAERQRLAVEADRQRQAAEAAERQRLAVEADRQRQAADAAARERQAELEMQRAWQVRQQQEAEERTRRERAGAASAGWAPAPPPPVAAATPGWAVARPASPTPRRRSRRRWIGVGLGLLLVAWLGAGVITYLDSQSLDPPPFDPIVPTDPAAPPLQATATMPDVFGLLPQDAAQRLRDARFANVGSAGSGASGLVPCDGQAFGTVFGVADASRTWIPAGTGVPSTLAVWIIVDDC